MVERYRRGKGKKKLLGSHQQCWVWGRNAVTETLRAGRWPIHELHLANHLPPVELESTRELALHLEVPVSVESADALTRRCRSAEHQGYLAKMPPYPYEDAAELLRQRPSRPLYAVLDSIQDPYNFGAIIRSADVLGVDGVFIGQTRQVEVTSLVARSSAGAVNHVSIAKVPDLVELVERLRGLSIHVVAASEKGATTLSECDFLQPMALIIGNEGTGITDELLGRCDQRVCIPQSGHVAALNAAVSAGILFYEVCRQRTLR